MFQDSLFLSNQQQKKVQFLQKIATFPNGVYSLHALSKQLEMNYQPCLQLVQEIDEELLELGECPLLSEERQLNWQADAARETTYLKYQLRESIPFQFLAATLFSPHISLADFLRTNFLSKSTLQRRMKPLTERLAAYGVSLNLTKMSLSGDETRVRMTYIHYFWGAITDLSPWCQDEFEEEKHFLQQWASEIRDLLPPQLAYIALIVCRLRNDSRHFLPEKPSPALLYSKIELGISTYLQEILRNTQQVNRNAEFLNFLFHYYPPVIEEDSLPARLRLALLDQNIHKPQGLDASFQELVWRCEQLLPETIATQQRDICRCNLLSVLLTYDLFHGPVPLFYEGTPIPVGQGSPALIELLVSQLKEIFQELSLSWLHSNPNKLIYALATTLSPFYRKELTRTLRVGVSLPKSFTSMIQLIQFLNHFTFVELIPNPLPSEVLDFFITADPELTPATGCDTFVISPFEEDYLLRLSTELIRCLHKTQQSTPTMPLPA